MEAKDLILTPIWIVLIYLIASKLRNKNIGDDLKKYFIWGLTLKIIGAIGFGLIYTFYYPGGDTKAFFEGAEIIHMYIGFYPISTLKFIFTPYIATDTEVFQAVSGYSYIFRGTSSLTVIKIITAINFLTFKSYFATSVIFAALSFSGLWKVYGSFCRSFPSYHRQLAIALFYIPSVFFWGSGISKDTIILGAIGWFIYAFLNIFYYKEKRIKSVIILLIAFSLISDIRGFVIIFLLLGLGLIPFLNFKEKIKNPSIRIMITPVLFMLAIFTGMILTSFLGQILETYSIGSLVEKAQDFQQWHGYLQEHYGGSGYSLGVSDYSTFGMVKSFIPAVNVSLFRPYLWEAYSIVIFLSAIESLILFVFTIKVIIKNGMRNIFNIIFSKPLVIFSFTFSIFYAFAAGFTSSNFGALVRYKIPCIPFFVITLLLITYYSNRDKKLSKLDTAEK